MDILKNTVPALSQEQIQFVREFITQSRDQQCADIIDKAFSTGSDIDLNEIRYPMSKYVKKAFNVFITKYQNIQTLKACDLSGKLSSTAVDAICVLHKRPPKDAYLKMFVLVFNKGLTQTEAQAKLGNLIAYPNINRACTAFSEITDKFKGPLEIG